MKTIFKIYFVLFFFLNFQYVSYAQSSITYAIKQDEEYDRNSHLYKSPIPKIVNVISLIVASLIALCFSLSWFFDAESKSFNIGSVFRSILAFLVPTGLLYGTLILPVWVIYGLVIYIKKLL